MASSQIGKIGEFIPSREDWTQHVEWLEHFFLANDIKSADKKRAVLLTVIGPTAYQRLWNLLSPTKLGDTPYKDLVDAMKKHVNPTPSVTVQRFKFNSHVCLVEETVSTYVLELRSTPEHCNFSELLDDMLRDCLICSINKEQIQCRLLAESKLTLKRALEIVQSLETAVQNVQALQGQPPVQPETVTHDIGKLTSTRTCFRCGKGSHPPTKCKFKEAKYHQCGKVGHIKPVCHSKPVDKADQLPMRQRNVHCVQDYMDTEPTKEYTLFNLTTNKRSHPFQVTVRVDGQDLAMEIDTGISLSLISEETQKSLWANKRLQPSTVKVCYGQQEAKFTLLVVHGRGPSLLGRNWLQSLQLNWQEIHSLHSCSLLEVLDKHAEIFKEGLGTLKDYQAKIYIDHDATPCLKFSRHALCLTLCSHWLTKN